MKVLVANLGSTSFKYQLLDMDTERCLAKGGIDRIGSAEASCCKVQIGDFRHEEMRMVADHGIAVETCLNALTSPDYGCIHDISEVSAIGFKAVVGGRMDGVYRVNPELLTCMEEAAFLAPAHNPAYIAAMRTLGERMPEMPLVAAFETEFHRTMPDRNKYYAIPMEWAEKFLVRRWGYHGASHRYIAGRAAELLDRKDLRVISCHLGGSSSICAIRDGMSVNCSFGMTPQTGLPHNARIGEFDAYALPILMKGLGKTLEEVLTLLGSKCGLSGMSGGTGDMRDLEAASEFGDYTAKLTMDVFATAVRNYIGAFLVELGGADLIAFTGGIGENQATFRAQVLAGMEFVGIEIDPTRNEGLRSEGEFSKDSSRTAVWVIPTNEELIVARLTKKVLES